MAMAGCCMISAKMIITKQSYSICDTTLSSHGSNRIMLPISQSFRRYQATRLLPNIKQNSTSFQCQCSKQDNRGKQQQRDPIPFRKDNPGSGLRLQTMINDVLFYIYKHPVILRIRLVFERLALYTYPIRSKKRKPRNISVNELPGVEAHLANFQLIIDFLQGNGKRKHDPFGIVIPHEGVLVYGPSGGGKTTLVHLVARKAGVSFFPVSASYISRMTDNQFIISLFGEARRCSPSIIFIDNVECISSSCHLKQIYDEMEMCKHDGSLVLVIVATYSRLDPAFLNGWFLKKVYVGYPNEDSKRKFLTLELKGAVWEEEKEAICNLVASQTSGLSWRFLSNVLCESQIKALVRGGDHVTMDDVVKVLEKIKDERQHIQFETESM